MLIQIEETPNDSRNARRDQKLWNDSVRRTPSLGCTGCLDRVVCGGLRVEQALFDCLQFCCGNKRDCDAVCRNNPKKFTERVREIGGFGLDNVPRSAHLGAIALPPIVPVLFHRARRQQSFTASKVVALPLYKAIGRHTGEARYSSARELRAGFGVAPEASVVLTGTGRDRPLERWWSLGTNRRRAIRALVHLGVDVITTPNFSLFTDQPRWDDMHSMKRIALVHEEFLSEGLQAALHLNARTEQDWKRWTEFVHDRAEITHVAFEFGTGAGMDSRIGWHANQLTELSIRVGRPLHLIVRGGSKVWREIRPAFSGMTILDTNTFMKTMYRRELRLDAEGELVEQGIALGLSEPLDELLENNWKATAQIRID